MARLPHDASAGHTDSNVHSHTTVLDANAGHTLTLPGHEYVTDAQMLRDGQDLVLHPAHGGDVVVKNYFSADPAPILSSADGGTALTHDLVESFVKPIGGVQYAQNGSMDDASPVGVVKESSGDGTITHANGTTQKAAIGTPIFEGDIVETKAHGAINITFVDKTTFAVSENAKMAIDKYVFDPATQHGENNFSVLRGVFVFTSGLIGHADPDDVKINTPVGSIGIRGTTIMGTINPGGDSHVSVVEGAIVVSNTAGEQTLSQQFETVKLNGMNQPITSEGVQSAETMANNYNVLRTVSGPLFSTFEDMGKTGDKPAATQAPAQDAPAAKDAAPAHDATPPADAAPVNKSDATQPAATQQAATALTQVDITDKASLDSGFDTSAGLKTTSTFSGDAGVAAAATTTTSIAAASSVTGPATASFTAAPSTSTGTMSASAPSTTSTSTTTTSTTTNNAGSSTSTASTTLPALTMNTAITTIPVTSLVAGAVLATITASQAGATFTSTAPVDGSNHELFTLTNSGGNGVITLNAAGVVFLANGGDIHYIVTASLPDGRTATSNNEVIVQVPTYDLSLNSVITGTGGIFIPSTATGQQHGAVVTALGDYNHDGRNDYAFTNNVGTNNTLYIDDSTGNHVSLNVGTGVYGIALSNNLSLASAGDFNGDGKGDIIFGAYMENSGGTIGGGTVFIASGANPTSSAVHVTGFADGDMAGMSVSSVGDFNGDGFADVIIGAPYYSSTGHAYVLFGHAGTNAIDISTLNPSQGFALSGTPGSMFGADVSGIGDFNRDGYGDFAVSDSGTNSVKVYFGNSAGFASTPLTIGGMATGSTLNVVDLGDNNGDNFSDFGIHDSAANKFYVFDGATSAAGGTTNVTAAHYTIAPATGTILTAGSAGDFNGDGINDTAVAIRNGSAVDVYVVYGGSNLTGTIDPATMTNTQGYHMHLDLTSSQFNLTNPSTDAVSVSLSSAGDQNGDGYDDLLIGLPNIDSNGGTHSDDGGLLIINGAPEIGGISGLVATAAGQSLVGTTGADTMSNGSTGFTGTSINAGAGNDLINMSGTTGNAHAIDGGTGIDTVNFLTGGASIDLRGLGENLSNIEKISLNSTGQSLTLGLDQVFNLLHQSESNTLTIDAATAGSNLTIDTNSNATSLTAAGFTDAGTTSNPGYHAWTQGAYTLYIDTDISAPVVANVA